MLHALLGAVAARADLGDFVVDESSSGAAEGGVDDGDEAAECAVHAVVGGLLAVGVDTRQTQRCAARNDRVGDGALLGCAASV